MDATSSQTDNALVLPVAIWGRHHAGELHQVAGGHAVDHLRLLALLYAQQQRLVLAPGELPPQAHPLRAALRQDVHES